MDARRPPSTTHDGVGTAALRLCRGDCAICGWRFGTIRDFAPCAARVFRWLRPAGISPAAAADRRRCPLDPAILGYPPFVGKRGRRGIFRQAKVRLCSHTGCMARSHTAGMAEKARRAPQTHGRWVALTRKNRVKLLFFMIQSTASQGYRTAICARRASMTSIIWMVSLWDMEGHSNRPSEIHRAVSNTSYS